ncbi:hypothetical protein FRC10_007690 [Ceratobasidium sp. 414]|nr:hypothetical protein FRC10_007690 [Ceratobasidium sp. 414]
MRTLNVARRSLTSRALGPAVKASTPFSSSASSCLPRKAPPDYPRRWYAQAAEDAPGVVASAKADPDNAQDIEKPKKRVGRPAGAPNKPPPPPTPVRAAVGPDVIWSGPTLDETRTLPPDDMLQDALAQLLVTIQPQTQYRAAYVGPGGSPLVEPTMALYCPIEGGDALQHVIDDTVKELASRIQADVIVIDAAQLAAGEHGSFGKAASVLKFQHNPLHFTSSPSGSLRSMSEELEMDDDEDMDENEEEDNGPRIMMGNVSALIPIRAVRLRSPNPFAPASSPSRNVPTGQSELKVFFESLINAPSPGASIIQVPNRPRIVYIRDFSLLAPSAQTWYPALLAAIRSRRQGVLLRPSHPVQNPTTLILGVSPSITSQPPPASPSPSSQMSSAAAGIMNMLMNQRNGVRIRTGQSEPPPVDDRARRLRDRLKRWSCSGSILDDLPPFSVPGSPPAQRAGFMSTNGFTSVFGPHPSSAGENAETKANDGASVGTGNKNGYFRVCGVVPAVRDEARERASRKARRAEVNTLVVKMAVGAVGGRVVGLPTTGAAKSSKTVKKDTDEKASEQKDLPPKADPAERMTDDWPKRVLDWPSARRLADRALACAVLASPDGIDTSATDADIQIPPPSSAAVEEPGPGLPVATAVSWDAVRTAWDTLRLALGYGQEGGKAEKPDEAPTPPPTPSAAKWSGIGSPKEPVQWIDAALHQEPTGSGVGKAPAATGQNTVDELVEKIKNDPDLETHEERLLGCIVNPAELETTFAQVHLPDATIDSVRTLVSLPLLYPAAFRSGILSQHAMTGALLFGPPGTGKTLVAKALAKESGAHMMLVKPSDVMDMASPAAVITNFYVGEGEKLVRSVFSLARRLSPCIIFLDEIDALLGARSSRDVGGAASAHRGLITEFMQEMDGLRSSSSSNVVVVGATNRPFDLDDAVLRRLPRRLLIDLPGLDEREAILGIMLSGENLDPDVDVKGLAKRTEGFSGSDLKNLVVAAALDAVKENVELPWRKTGGKKAGATTVDVPSKTAAPDTTSLGAPVPDTTPVAPEPAAGPEPSASPATADLPSRILSERHIARALKEITPSASEALGTLADLRKWNAEFGQGDRKKNAKAWGGRFGFGGSGKKEGEGIGKVGGVEVDERA